MKKTIILIAIAIFIVSILLMGTSCKEKVIPVAKETKNIIEEETEKTISGSELESEDQVITEKIIEVSLKITVWNLTEKNEPDLEIWIKGTGSWYPDKESIEFGGDFFIPSEPFSSGKVNEIYIYPDSRTGTEIMIEIIVTDEMISESDRDTIHIEIYDETVEIYGTSIVGITQEFKR